MIFFLDLDGPHPEVVHAQIIEQLDRDLLVGVVFEHKPEEVIAEKVVVDLVGSPVRVVGGLLDPRPAGFIDACQI